MEETENIVAQSKPCVPKRQIKGISNIIEGQLNFNYIQKLEIQLGPWISRQDMENFPYNFMCPIEVYWLFFLICYQGKGWRKIKGIEEKKSMVDEHI